MIVTSPRAAQREQASARRTFPRLGFVGAGWIGRHRLEAVHRAGVAEIAAVCDPLPEAVEATREVVPTVARADTFLELLDQDLDGVVIATPSALHADQTRAALDRGLAVFCQKPLARTAAETEAILDSARTADRLLSVDFSYRHVRGVDLARELVRSGELGDVFAVDLVFHNAYGPDKSWFRNPALSGGGCVIDLGIHLVDLSQWMLGFPAVDEVRSRLYSAGRELAELDDETVEDCAFADWRTDAGASVRLACSWNLPAGRDAVIEAVFYGTRGMVALRNVGGSFFDFDVDHCIGTNRERIAEPPDDWGGRAIVAWAERLSRSNRFDPDAEHLLDVANLVDRIYRR